MTAKSVQVNRVLRIALQEPTPEELMWLAVIQQAVLDLRKKEYKHNTGNRILAYKFLASRNAKEICELAGLNYEFVCNCISRMGVYLR